MVNQINRMRISSFYFFSNRNLFDFQFFIILILNLFIQRYDEIYVLQCKYFEKNFLRCIKNRFIVLHGILPLQIFKYQVATVHRCIGMTPMVIYGAMKCINSVTWLWTVRNRSKQAGSPYGWECWPALFEKTTSTNWHVFAFFFN